MEAPSPQCKRPKFAIVTKSEPGRGQRASSAARSRLVRTCHAPLSCKRHPHAPIDFFALLTPAEGLLTAWRTPRTVDAGVLADTRTCRVAGLSRSAHATAAGKSHSRACAAFRRILGTRGAKSRQDSVNRAIQDCHWFYKMYSTYRRHFVERPI